MRVLITGQKLIHAEYIRNQHNNIHHEGKSIAHVDTDDNCQKKGKRYKAWCPICSSDWYKKGR